MQWLSKHLGNCNVDPHKIEHPPCCSYSKLPIKLQVLGILHVSLKDVLPTLDSESFDEKHSYSPVTLPLSFFSPLVCQPENTAVGAFLKRFFFFFLGRLVCS